ncbi:tetraspanin-8-like [Boleophthalmus pectinirostris]|uniref:tetraspanin-8-like n=1 Tax=Boleophthalmus pectinirostris TaxID=150288 RepID=UPI000A1C3FC8|nr:tetraspanin-8-like [Boleophthalmus pectinirostris]
MGDINTCLKRTFTIFNIIFAIVGGLIIFLAILAQILTSIHGAENLENRTFSLILMYVVGAITMVIAILGAYGAHKEKTGPLIAFLVCMVIGSLIMLRFGINTAFARPQLEPVLQETFRRFLPLDQAQSKVQEMTNDMQSQIQCCGLFSYKDWRDNIPDTCLCNQEYEDNCMNIGYNVFTPKKSVYSRPCFPILMHYVLLVADVLLGIVFTLAALAILGLGLSSLMIHQLRHRNRAPMVANLPAIFSPQPPKYQELQNPPSYPGY